HRGRAHVRTYVRTEEDVLELHHPRVGEHQRRIVARHQGAGRDDRVAFRLEELQELFTDFGRFHVGENGVASWLGNRKLYVISVQCPCPRHGLKCGKNHETPDISPLATPRHRGIQSDPGASYLTVAVTPANCGPIRSMRSVQKPSTPHDRICVARTGSLTV